MYTNPEIFNSQKLTIRVYVYFYFQNKRVREYSGKCIGLNILPGRAKTVAARTVLLKQLCNAIQKALDSDQYKKEQEVKTSLASVFKSALKSKLDSKLSLTYKRDLGYTYNQFLKFLTMKEKNEPLEDLPLQRVAEFLQQYNTSNTYYMNKRTVLAALFSTAGRMLDVKVEAVKRTARKKPKSVLNAAYTKEEVKKLLEYLKSHHTQLYYCCILLYSTWLRPHLEIRCLRKSHFSEDYSLIMLSGSENKGGRVRTVFVPEYTREILKSRLDAIGSDDNLFSEEQKPFNPDYFKTSWNRLRKTLLAKKLIKQNQTIYSFRHTAAIATYRKSKDIYLLQKLLGHSSIGVTQKYLRGLGEVDIEELRDAAPEL